MKKAGAMKIVDLAPAFLYCLVVFHIKRYPCPKQQIYGTILIMDRYR